MGSGKLPADGTNSPKRLYYIDILNILSCFAVVVLHCSGGVFYYQKTRLWFMVIRVLVPRVSISVKLRVWMCSNRAWRRAVE